MEGLCLGPSPSPRIHRSSHRQKASQAVSRVGQTQGLARSLGLATFLASSGNLRAPACLQFKSVMTQGRGSLVSCRLWGRTELDTFK